MLPSHCADFASRACPIGIRGRRDACAQNRRVNAVNTPLCYKMTSNQNGAWR